jgi:hypothetical protein
VNLPRHAWLRLVRKCVCGACAGMMVYSLTGRPEGMAFAAPMLICGAVSAWMARKKNGEE